MRLFRPLRTLWRRFNAWLYSPFLTAQESAALDAIENGPPPAWCHGCGLNHCAAFPCEPSVRVRSDGVPRCNDCQLIIERAQARRMPAAPVESAASRARDAIRDALDQYIRTNARYDQPRLHVSREAWNAICADTFLVADNNPRYRGVTEYAGCPVTVANTAGRPGIWCDALPPMINYRPVFAPLRRHPLSPCLNMPQAVTTQPLPAGMTCSDAPPTEAEREILAEFNGVELQTGATEEDECESAETMLREYERGE